MKEPNIIKRNMDSYDLAIIKKIRTCGVKLEEFNANEFYSIHVYSYMLDDGIKVQAALVLYKDECVEYFIRDISDEGWSNDRV